MIVGVWSMVVALWQQYEDYYYIYTYAYILLFLCRREYGAIGPVRNQEQVSKIKEEIVTLWHRYILIVYTYRIIGVLSTHRY